MAPAIDLDYIHKFVPAHPDSSHPVTLVLFMAPEGTRTRSFLLEINFGRGAALLGTRKDQTAEDVFLELEDLPK